MEMTGLDELPDVLAGSTDRLKNMGETGTGMPGVMPASMSRSLNINSQAEGLELPMEMNPKMTSSMTMGSSNSLNKQPHSRRQYTHRNATSQNWFTFDDDDSTGRADLAAKEKEREERIRKMKEAQEDQRKKKLEELKQHALQAQKFREQQEVERRKHIEELRSRDMDRRAQVEERRREIEKAEQERREQILAKNKERAERIESQRRNSRGNLELAFGSSAPRLMEHRDSSNWATRSTYDRRSSERELDLRSKRTTSAQALDRNPEGDDAPSLLSSAPPTAHRRRTDLIPTLLAGGGLLAARGGGGGLRSSPNTPGRAASAPRLDQLVPCPRPRFYGGGGNSMRAGGATPSKSMVTLLLDNNSNNSAAGSTVSLGPHTTTTSRTVGGRGLMHATSSSSSSTAGGGGRMITRSATFRTSGGSSRGLPTADRQTAAASRESAATRRQRAVTSAGGKALIDKSPGLSRENSTTSRPSSAMSGGAASRAGQVRMRPSTAGGRRPRPLSIATTGMTSSMYEERQKPVLRNRTSATPKLDRNKRARSINGEQLEDDQRSTGSSTGCGPVNSNPVRPSSARKTPAQVKAENAARRAKLAPRPKSEAVTGSAPAVNTVISSSNNGSSSDFGAKLESADFGGKMMITDDASDSGGGNEAGERQITPDIIKGQDNSKSESDEQQQQPAVVPAAPEAAVDAAGDREERPAAERKIITSEEEAKARIAEKRKEMKEKMEREAEIERLRLEAEARAEEERRRAEEEEERRMIEETERLAAEARRVEEERIQKAMEEAAERARKEKEEEDKIRKEKEEAERKAREEAEKREKELQELQEKRLKEEEERLARKRKVEAIMARTRGKGGTPTGTPKKEADKVDGAAEATSQSLGSQPPSLDTNVDPTKPDLLGDITEPPPVSAAVSDGAASSAPVSGFSDSNVSDTTSTPAAVAPEQQAEQPAVICENGDDSPLDAVEQRNNHVIENGVGGENDEPTTTHSNGDVGGNHAADDDTKDWRDEAVEKGALDSISNKSEDSSESTNKISSNHSQLIEVDTTGKMSAIENDFDQILDLSGEVGGGSSSEVAAPQPPIIAFEATQHQTDLLS